MTRRGEIIALGLVSLLAMGVYGAAVSLSAVTNGSFVVSWTPATDPAEEYEFRWSNFSSPQWASLPTVAGSLGSLRVTFTAVPNTPLTDRWMCVDARMVKPTIGAWLSETSAGPACEQVEAAAVVVPPPPAPIPPVPPPSPMPPAPELFSGLSNSNGVLSFTYKQNDCPRGVQQSTGALINGARTIMLRCRR